MKQNSFCCVALAFVSLCPVLWSYPSSSCGCIFLECAYQQCCLMTWGLCFNINRCEVEEILVPYSSSMHTSTLVTCRLEPWKLNVLLGCKGILLSEVQNLTFRSNWLRDKQVLVRQNVKQEEYLTCQQLFRNGADVLGNCVLKARLITVLCKR